VIKEFDSISQMFERQGINLTEHAPSPLGAYSHAVKAGPFLFVSGQGCRNADTGIECGITLDSDGRAIGYDIAAQTHGCLKNLIAVLQAAGCSLQDVVDMTVFLADMDDFPSYNQVYAQYFNFAEPPARTTIQAARLPGKNFIEIKAIALLKQPQGD
jgi:reactive intermediate/imine deaminase